MKIGILSTFGHPFAGYMLKELTKKINFDSIILDELGFKKKDSEIWYQRTLNRIPYIDILKEKKIPLLPVNSHSGDQVINLIKKRNIDLLINFGTPGILKGEILKAPKIGILNCHPGILPNYRGCTCVEWALYNCDDIGNSCHIMTSSIDEGPIIHTEKIAITETMTYQDIRILVYLNQIEVIYKSILLLKKNNLKSFKTPKKGKYYSVIPRKFMHKIYKKYRNEIE